MAREWYSVTEQPAPAPHLARPDGCDALRIVLVPRVSRSCEHLPDGFDLNLLRDMATTDLLRLRTDRRVSSRRARGGRGEWGYGGIPPLAACPQRPFLAAGGRQQRPFLRVPLSDARHRHKARVLRDVRLNMQHAAGRALRPCHAASPLGVFQVVQRPETDGSLVHASRRVHGKLVRVHRAT